VLDALLEEPEASQEASQLEVLFTKGIFVKKKSLTVSYS
jgi:hypothetical protein